MNQFPNRKPNRLPSYDYASNGSYFITICTKDQKSLFGKVEGLPDEDCCVVLSEWGRIVEQAILEIPVHYEDVTLDRYVIMPNHIHLLLSLSPCGGRMISAPTVVGSMKRAVTKHLGASVWQKGFHDHVIRNESDYAYHLQYIDENPKKWLLGKDEYYA